MARGRKTYEDVLKEWSKEFTACRIVHEDPESKWYVRCELCQEPYLKEDFHCNYSHKNFTKEQAEEFKQHTKRARYQRFPVKYLQHSNAFKAIKALIFDVEVAIPTDAVRSDETSEIRELWLEKLKRADSAKALGQCLLELEQKHDKDWLRPSFDPRAWRHGLASCDTPSKLKNHLLIFDKNIFYSRPNSQSAMEESISRAYNFYNNSGEYPEIDERGVKRKSEDGSSGSGNKRVKKEDSDSVRAGHCAYCKRDIRMCVRVACKECKSLELCLECLSQGRFLSPHTKDHRLLVIDTPHKTVANFKRVKVEGGSEEDKANMFFEQILDNDFHEKASDKFKNLQQHSQGSEFFSSDSENRTPSSQGKKMNNSSSNAKMVSGSHDTNIGVCVQEMSYQDILNLAMCYSYGYGTCRDTKKAYATLNKAKEMMEKRGKFEKGHVEPESKFEKTLLESEKSKTQRAKILFALGICSEYGHGTHRAVRKARDYYERASNLGLGVAMVKLAECKIMGIGGAKDEAVGESLLQRVLKSTDAPGMYLAGLFYAATKGLGAEANKAFQLASDLKHAKAAFNVAVMITSSENDNNMIKAIDYYKLAAERGDVRAKYNLSVCYESGSGIEKDEKKAIELLMEASNVGHVRSMYNLARHRALGKNPQEAVRLFKKAAARRHVASMYNLGVMYQSRMVRAEDSGSDDNDVATDLEAVFWYTQAAENGSARAMFNLA
ncbi:hypothetical protein AAMO2058_000934200 [Amorphochlora amoebiformis]